MVDAESAERLHGLVELLSSLVAPFPRPPLHPGLGPGDVPDKVSERGERRRCVRPHDKKVSARCIYQHLEGPY